MSRVGDTIRRQRLSMGRTQRQFARYMAIDREAVRQAEEGARLCDSHRQDFERSLGVRLPVEDDRG